MPPKPVAFIEQIPNADPVLKTELVLPIIELLVASRALVINAPEGTLHYPDGTSTKLFTLAVWQQIYRAHLFKYTPGIIKILRACQRTIAQILKINDITYIKFSLAEPLWDIITPEIISTSQPCFFIRCQHPIISILKPSLNPNRNRDGYYIAGDTENFIYILGIVNSIASILDDASSNNAKVWTRAFAEGILNIAFFLRIYMQEAQQVLRLINLLLDPETLKKASEEPTFLDTICALITEYNIMYLPINNDITPGQTQILAQYLRQHNLVHAQTFRNMDTKRWVELILNAFGYPTVVPLYRYTEAKDHRIAESVDGIHNMLEPIFIQLLKTSWIYDAWKAGLIHIDDCGMYYIDNGEEHTLTFTQFLSLLQRPKEALKLACAHIVTIPELLEMNRQKCDALYTAYIAFLPHPNLLNILVNRDKFELLKKYCLDVSSDLSRIQRFSHPIVQEYIYQGAILIGVIPLILDMEEKKWEHLTHLPPLLSQAIITGILPLEQALTYYHRHPIDTIDKVCEAFGEYIQAVSDEIAILHQGALTSGESKISVTIPTILEKLGITDGMTTAFIHAVLKQKPTTRNRGISSPTLALSLMQDSVQVETRPSQDSRSPHDNTISYPSPLPLVPKPNPSTNTREPVNVKLCPCVML